MLKMKRVSETFEMKVFTDAGDYFGDVEESYLHNQGWDEAIFTLYNQFAGQMFTPEAEESFYTRGWRRDTWDKRYAVDKKFRPTDWLWAVEGVEGGTTKEVATPKTFQEYVDFNAMAYNRVKDFIRRNAKGNKPFLLDWWPNLIEAADRGTMYQRRPREVAQALKVS
jgi:hypothetical protein